MTSSDTSPSRLGEDIKELDERDRLGCGQCLAVDTYRE
jgi:hypothetical protein